MKLKNHSQTPPKCSLSKVSHWAGAAVPGWESRGAARGVVVLPATPTPCTGTRFSWTSPESQECMKIKWISKPHNANKSQRRIRLLCFTLSVCLFKVAFVFYFIVSVTINVGHLQRWKPAASSVSQSLQQSDKEIITNSLSRKIIVATL